MKSIDIVFPKNNEEAFIKIALELGTKELIFLYPFVEYKSKQWNEKGLTIKTGILALPKQVRDAQKKAEIVVVKAAGETDLHTLEHFPSAIMYGFEFSERKDFMHHRNSGMNHMHAAMMAEKNVIYGFPVAALVHAEEKLKGEIVGRLRQNIALAQKYKVKVVLASFASDPMDMRNGKDVWCLV